MGIRPLRPFESRSAWGTQDVYRFCWSKPALRTSISEEHTSELQSPDHLVCRLLLEKKKTREHQPVSGVPKDLARRVRPIIGHLAASAPPNARVAGHCSHRHLNQKSSTVTS